MDSEKDYGKCFFQMPFKEAIRQGIISDYKIITMTVSDSHIRQLIADNHILNLNLRNLDEAEAQSAAAGIALKRLFKEHGIKHAISFHRSISAADRFREQQDALNSLRNAGPRTTNLHVSSKKTAGQRTELLLEFTDHKRSLLTNARCLTEGVDVPAIDCVLFADPKQSLVDIVQAAGRALRCFPGKEYGYILLPLIVPEKMDFQNFAETTAFRQVVRTITALSTQDERLAEEFRAIERGRKLSGKIVEIEGDVAVGMKIRLSVFAEAISTRIWDSVGRANWRAFPLAREFVRSLGLKSRAKWETYRKSDRRPPDIPTNPNTKYAHSGWISMGDWRGTGNLAPQLRKFRPFAGARTFARTLGLNSTSKWRAYSKSGLLPPDIPTNPNRQYRNEGWISWADWLGTTTIATNQRRYRPYPQARAFVHPLGLKSANEWRAYSKSGNLPMDIPANPTRTYAKKGWTNWGDWLG
jgi:Helicase conserved C-terminal domain